MFGRSAELAAVTTALSAVGGSGTALVIDGEAGIGKSTLLSAAAEAAAATGYRVLRCSGLQSQTEVGFAGIHELIHPVLAQAEALPRRQRAALMTAFGLEDGPPPDRLLVSLAVLGLLEESATTGRLLLLVDDAQWLDQSSLDVLAFVARRLSNAPLLLLCAERARMGGHTPRLEGIQRLELGPLRPEESEQLLTHTLREAPRTLDVHLRRRVLDEAGGNPLAVIELGAALGRHRTGRIPVGEPLPTSQRVERAFLAQLDALPEDSRLLLLLIAAAHGSVAEIHLAARHAGLSLPDQLAPLERAGLVTVGGGQMLVRHPLIRSTVYGAAALSDRARVHRALADATADAMRAAWHRAEATFGTDERLAADLERAAGSTLARGAGAEAAAALRRAALLSPEVKDRVRRLAAAAEAARGAGATAEAISILTEAQPLAEEQSGAQRLAITRFVLNMTAAIPGHPAEVLAALAAGYPDGDSGQRELLWAAAIEWRMHGRDERSRRTIAAALRRLVGTWDDPHTDVAAALVDDVGAGQRLRRRLPVLIDGLGEDPLLAMSLAFAAEAVSDRSNAARCWTHVQNFARARNSTADECEGLRGTAQLLIQQGRIRAAAITAHHALRMAEDMNLPMTAASAAATLARAQVWQGGPSHARDTLTRARELLAPVPTILWNDDAHWAAGLAALCEADHAEALHQLLRMTRHRTSRRWAVADLAEAAAGCDRADAVRPQLIEIEEQAERFGGLDLMLARRARALLAGTDGAAEDHFRAALHDSENLDAELEVARTRLLYGEWLRRNRRIADARPHLAAALTAFDTAGAVPFAARAAAELRAAGVSAPGAAAAGPAATLTSQELQIAQLAAAGLTNREIADRIYVSHRTVAAHLYKLFPKLGITSRSQLHAALGDAAKQ
ncbi:AAA family ATPase [Nocardia cerradoensis]|nr:AAA family ATPase [Nocardia cerradoensis]